MHTGGLCNTVGRGGGEETDRQTICMRLHVCVCCVCVCMCVCVLKERDGWGMVLFCLKKKDGRTPGK